MFICPVHWSHTCPARLRRGPGPAFTSLWFPRISATAAREGACEGLVGEEEVVDLKKKEKKKRKERMAVDVVCVCAQRTVYRGSHVLSAAAAALGAQAEKQHLAPKMRFAWPRLPSQRVVTMKAIYKLLF